MAEKEIEIEIERQASELHKRVSGWQKDAYHARKTALGDFKAKGMDSCREGYYSLQNTSLANQTIRGVANGRFSTPGELQTKSDTTIPATEEPSINGVFVMPQYIRGPSSAIPSNVASNDGNQGEEEENGQGGAGEYR